MDNVEKAGLVSALLGFGSIGVMVAGWITHIVVCLREEQFLLLIGGAIMFPVGVIHGIGCWFGWWL